MLNSFFSLCLLMIAAFALTYAGVEIFRRWALSKKIYDLPNERSSHTTAIPRGGGLVLIFVCLSFYAFAAVWSGGTISYGYLAGSLLIAVVSFADDLKPKPFWLRMPVHCLAAAILIGQQGAWSKIEIPLLGTVDFGLYGILISFLWIVGLINAYNFMDGIDGLAAVQAIAAGIGWCAAGCLTGSSAAAVVGGLTAGASFGFYLHNKNPAKIFMGDSGSTFLGYTFAALPFLAGGGAAGKDALLPWTGLLLVWFFVFDTVLTLLHRSFQRKKIWQAHREHLYQKISQVGGSQRKVTAIYGFCAFLVTGLLIYNLSAGGNFTPLTAAAVILSAGIYLYQRQLSAPENKVEKLKSEKSEK